MNGKALMSGIKLQEMEASEMLDVFHYLFEEDFSASSGEEAQAKSDVRSMIYRELYGQKYKYAIDARKTKYNGQRTERADGSDYGDLTPFDPEFATTKPYIPPTDFEENSYLPFGEELGAPLN